MRVYCRTNLDLVRNAEKWPEKMQHIPQVGDLIRSAYKWQNLYQVELEVCQITWVEKEQDHGVYKDWIPHIELRLPKSRFENLTAFYEWYGKITSKGKSAFI